MFLSAWLMSKDILFTLNSFTSSWYLHLRSIWTFFPTNLHLYLVQTPEQWLMVKFGLRYSKHFRNLQIWSMLLCHNLQERKISERMFYLTFSIFLRHFESNSQSLMLGATGYPHSTCLILMLSLLHQNILVICKL